MDAARHCAALCRNYVSCQSSFAPSEWRAEVAWEHIVAMLAAASMTVSDLVKVTHYLLTADDIPGYVKVHARFLGEARPASMLLVVPELVRPEFLLEIESIAAKD